jgi:hypothetical protein
MKYLSSNATYEFAVSAVTSMGIGLKSGSSAAATTLPPQLSLPPQHLRVVASSFTTMTVHWSPPLDTMGYQLTAYVKSVFIIHVGCTRRVTSSTDQYYETTGLDHMLDV